MNPSASPSPLRPLGLGELLDRAVTLCVRYIVPFALIQAVFSLPVGILNYFATRNYSALIQALTDDMVDRAQGKAKAGDSLSAALGGTSQNSLGDFGWSLGVLAFSFLFYPLVTAALIDSTSATYVGRAPTFRQAYRVGVARWLNMIGINLLYGVCGSVVYVVAVIGVVFAVLAIAAIGSAAKTVAIVIGVIIGLVFLVAVLALAILVTMALQMSYFACVLERLNFANAFVKGISRISRGVGIKRALLVGLAYFAAIFAITLVSGAGQVVLTGLLHSGVAGIAFVTIVSVGTSAFTTAFMTIFYFDLRVREDGLDLEIDAEAT